MARRLCNNPSFVARTSACNQQANLANLDRRISQRFRRRTAHHELVIVNLQVLGDITRGSEIALPARDFDGFGVLVVILHQSRAVNDLTKHTASAKPGLLDWELVDLMRGRL